MRHYIIFVKKEGNDNQEDDIKIDIYNLNLFIKLYEPCSYTTFLKYVKNKMTDEMDISYKDFKFTHEKHGKVIIKRIIDCDEDPYAKMLRIRKLKEKYDKEIFEGISEKSEKSMESETTEIKRGRGRPRKVLE